VQQSTEGPEGRCEGRQWQAGPPQDDRVCRARVGQHPVQEGGLADAGLPSHQECRRNVRPRAVEDEEGTRQLRIPAHEGHVGVRSRLTHPPTVSAPPSHVHAVSWSSSTSAARPAARLRRLMRALRREGCGGGQEWTRAPFGMARGAHVTARHRRVEHHRRRSATCHGDSWASLVDRWLWVRVPSPALAPLVDMFGRRFVVKV